VQEARYRAEENKRNIQDGRKKGDQIWTGLLEGESGGIGIPRVVLMQEVILPGISGDTLQGASDGKRGSPHKATL